MAERTYLSIDLKSFYASVECIERGLDPMTTHLVVADQSRTEKTICLAVSPALKAYGISGRARLFEVVQKVKEVNAQRQRKAPGGILTGSSHQAPQILACPQLALDYLVAPPQMAHYIDFSTRIYQVYLKYIAPEDMHVYSIDEVFMDITHYLDTYGMTPQELAQTILLDVLHTTGITATAGIGTNLYLAKVAMDVEAKHIRPDKNGVRIACLDEMSYRRNLWTHRPLTDFWRVGRGYAKKLERQGLYTMGDIARCSLGKPSDYYNQELLYKLFGVNAQLLIDHAWGWEPCTIADIKAYRPSANSLGSGQVLQYPYEADKARLVVREMTDLLVLDLVDHRLVTNQITLTVGYDRTNLEDPQRRQAYHGAVSTDVYGRVIPKHAHGTANLERYTSSAREIEAAMTRLFDRIVNPNLLVRRLNITANRVLREDCLPQDRPQQMSLFADDSQQEQIRLERERQKQQAILTIKKKYGKNAVLKGMNLQEGATARQRNNQIGGHKA
ncbi:DNA methylase [Pseudoflavonifractor capillosus]|uniref:Y-family DNA polymerase n=1 Tax=Pseudoflavonifractor capillosus TaxID=106588 RepID=UPI001958F9A7|nr:DNA methylase [Pseudoflavonifractor capillosus]MBM6896342.1 DNA methylase [Pseudoflavonifractor capillosus]